MLWHRTVKKDGSEKWIAVGPDGKPQPDNDGNFWTRYEARAGAPIYKSKKKNLIDKNFKPEDFPDGVDRNTPAGFISAFLLTPEAKRDWDFLEYDWKRRRTTQLQHAGCGEADWTEVSRNAPITCPVCGVLPKDATLYARWCTSTKTDGAGVEVCVYEAWLSGEYLEYQTGRIPPGALRAYAFEKPSPLPDEGPPEKSAYPMPSCPELVPTPPPVVARIPRTRPAVALFSKAPQRPPVPVSVIYPPPQDAPYKETDNWLLFLVITLTVTILFGVIALILSS